MFVYGAKNIFGAQPLKKQCPNVPNTIYSMKNIKAEIAQVVCGEHFTFFLTTTQKLFSVGHNTYGQLALGYKRPVSGINEVTSIQDQVVAIHCGNSKFFSYNEF
jgi:alpha-tubulin suppressor-like RCC1 family protein